MADNLELKPMESQESTYYSHEPRQKNEDDVDDKVSMLLSFMRAQDLGSFKNLLEGESTPFNLGGRTYTFLHHACEYGLHNFLYCLLKKGADLRLSRKEDTNKCLILACKKGYYKIVQLLLRDIDLFGEQKLFGSLFYNIIEDTGSKTTSFLGATNQWQDHSRCLEMLLKNAFRNRSPFVETGSLGYKLWYNVAKSDNRDVIFAFLNFGAYIGQKDSSGMPVLAYISRKTLEAYLDQCITDYRLIPLLKEQAITFNCNFLVPSTTNKTTTTSETDPILSKTDPLLYMSASRELRPLLKHPVLTSFIHLKWYSIQWFSYYNLIFHAFFWLLLTINILRFYNNKDFQQKNVTYCIMSPQNGTDRTTVPLPVDWECNLYIIMWCTLVIFLWMLVVREVFQLCVSPVRYVISVESWLEVLLVIVTGVILLENSTNIPRNPTAAAGILISWVELLLHTYRAAPTAMY